MTAEKILALARSQIGVTEQPPNSNTVLYNTEYYNRKVNGSNYAWCAVFLWWLFRECEAHDLYFDGKKTAFCPTLLDFHIRKGQQVRDGQYEPGDIVCFNFNGETSASHVGICECFDGEYMTSIDGNTGTGNEANGGAVMRRRRHKKYVVGGYRPKYEKTAPEAVEEDKEMPRYRTLNDVPAWYKPTIQKLMEQGALVGKENPDPDSLEDNVIDVTEDYCRVMVTLEKLGII